MLKKRFKKFAKNVNNPKKLQGYLFVLTLFAVAGMLFSQTAVYLALTNR